MKKHFTLTLVALAAAVGSFAQGINFETGDWKAVIAKAKKENKLVYVDMYTTWCGPCKMLAKNIFPLKAAGDKYNKLFVNYRMDAEKGEGIKIAAKYAVNGYPTHLFIDPKNEAVVYRDMGAPQEVEGFNHHADVAIQEKNDPMTWDKYTAQYKSGKKDKAFLKNYLEKAHRLSKDNDAILNDYIAASGNKLSDEDITWFAQIIRTVDNDAIAILVERKDAVAKAYNNDPEAFDHMVSSWTYGTLEKAVATKDATLLTKIDEARSKYLGKQKDAESYYFRTQYYSKVGDEEKALKAGVEEADYLATKTVGDYAKEDEKAAERYRAAIREQVKAANVPADKIDEMVEMNMNKQPQLLHSESVQAATKLNEIAWKFYENYSKDPALVQQAMGWSKLSTELTANTPDWTSFADTYAHLLFVAGYQKEAIALQEQAVTKAKAQKSEDATSLVESLQQMKSGKL